MWGHLQRDGIMTSIIAFDLLPSLGANHKHAPQNKIYLSACD
jgi:hypothetical protein